MRRANLVSLNHTSRFRVLLVSYHCADGDGEACSRKFVKTPKANLLFRTVYRTSSNPAGVYGPVAAIVLFQGAYTFGWTPLLYLYPPEVLHYPIRANGMGVFQFALNGTALLIVFTMPIALANIGWKAYMATTKGKTLEEIDAVLEGVKHSDVPDLEMIYKGKTLEEIDAVLEGAKHSDVPDLEMIYKGKEDVGESLAIEVNELKD